MPFRKKWVNMSATADKVDHGVMVFRVTAKDLDNLKHILERPGWNNKKPNFCHYVYKNRGGSRVGVIIWTRYNGGVIREDELFVTDLDYNLLNVENMKIEFRDEVTEEERAKEETFINEHMDEEADFVEEGIPEF